MVDSCREYSTKKETEYKSIKMSTYWMMKRRGNKYNNQKVELDGHKFDSQKEMRRYAELKLLQDAGEIEIDPIWDKWIAMANGEIDK